MYSIENASTQILTEYFGEFSITSKAYRTQGDENLLFREVARVLLEYGFVHPRPLAMPKNRAGFIITTFEGFKVNWPVIVVDSLWTAIAVVARKLWLDWHSG